MKNNKTIYKILTGIFAAGFVICLVLLGYDAFQKQNAANKYEQLAQETLSSTEEDIETDFDGKEESSLPEKNLDWEALWEENKDIYAWISIPGTVIEYPVLQHPTDDNYYLMRNVDGSSGYPGCIYTQSLNSKDFTDFNTVLYGHNMKNGTMFADLHDFEDNLFFEENRYIYIYTPEKSLKYEIFAAYEFIDAHILYTFDFQQESIRENYLETILSIRDMNAHIWEESEVNADSKIITLSTCISTKPDNRYLVQGVLVEEVEN